MTNTTPSTLSPGEKRNVAITFRNTGSASPANDWSSSYSVIGSGPDGARLFRQVSGTVPASAANPVDSEATFRFLVEAPGAGATSLSAQMFSSVGGSEGYFGTAANTAITVDPAALRGFDCEFVSSNAGSLSLNRGSVETLEVTVRNTGTTDWTPGSFCLYSTDSTLDQWGSNARCTTVDSTVSGAPPGGPTSAGSTYTFNVEITAPNSDGTFDFHRQMFQLGTVAQGSIGFFDDGLNCVELSLVVNPGAAAFDATVDLANSTLDEATTMKPSEVRRVTLTFDNDGQSDWTAGQFSFFNRNTPDTLWGLRNINLGTTVAAGASRTETFLITAPATPGDYTHAWQVYGNSPGFFGDVTGFAVNVDAANTAQYDAVSVANTASTIYQNNTVLSNRAVTLTIQMQNTGSQTWNPGEVELRSANSPSGLWGGVGAVALGSSVAPGATATFTIATTAPVTPGSQTSAWRMWDISATQPVGKFGSTSSQSFTVVQNGCGNGVPESGEGCDDGNTTSNDGCSSSCTIEPETVSLTPGTPADRSFYGRESNRRFSKVAIGDVNGDGYADLAAGSYESAEVQLTNPVVTQRRPLSGAVYVYAGGAGFFDGTSTRADQASPSLYIGGADSRDYLAGNVDGFVMIGDVVGDSTADIVVSAPAAKCENDTDECGRIYVIEGGSSLFTQPNGEIDLKYSTAVTARLIGTHVGGRAAVIALGDVTGDGKKDIIVGNRLADPSGRTDAGVVQVVDGGGTLTGTITLTGAAIRAEIFGAVAGDGLGLIAAVGDLDGSGANDLLLGAPNHESDRRGGAWALFDSTLSGTIDLSTTWDIRWRGQGTRDYVGSSVAVGHVSGTTAADALIGVEYWKTPGQRYGAVEIWDGPFVAGGDYVLETDEPDARLRGERAGDAVGRCVAAFDMSGDGVRDVIFGGFSGAGQGGGLSQAGQLAVIFGATNLTTQRVGTNTPLQVFGGSDRARMCLLPGSLDGGDLDGDGRADICVGSADANVTGSALDRPGRIDCIKAF